MKETKSRIVGDRREYAPGMAMSAGASELSPVFLCV